MQVQVEDLLASTVRFGQFLGIDGISFDTSTRVDTTYEEVPWVMFYKLLMPIEDSVRTLRMEV